MRTTTLTLAAFGVLTLTAAAELADDCGMTSPLREILIHDTAAATLKQVNFDREYLLLIRWTGSGTDQLAYGADEGKDGPLVIFRLKPGKGKDKLRPFSRLFVLTKDAAWRVEKDTAGRRTVPTIITSAEEFKKALPDGGQQ